MLLFPALLIICGIPLFFLNIAYIKSRDLNVGLLVLLNPLFIQQFSRVFWHALCFLFHCELVVS